MRETTNGQAAALWGGAGISVTGVGSISTAWAQQPHWVPGFWIGGGLIALGLIFAAAALASIYRHKKAPGQPGLTSSIQADAVVAAMGNISVGGDLHVSSQGSSAGQSPAFILSHDEACLQCSGPDFGNDETRGWPVTRIEVRNASADKPIEDAHLEIVSISPTPVPTKGWFDYPIPLAHWPSLNPGAAAQHAPVFHWDITRGNLWFGLPKCGTPHGEYEITIAAHARNTQGLRVKYRTRFNIETDFGYRLLPVD